MEQRFLAEQMRFTAMSYPLSALPGPLSTPLWQIYKKGCHRIARLRSAELWQLQRALREQGLPLDNKGTAEYTPSLHIPQLADYVKAVIQDQISYHHKNEQECHQLHERLHYLTIGFFALTLAAVVSHFLWHPTWLLMLTAFLPAFAASIHGVLTNLEFSRLAKQSALTATRLEALCESITKLEQDYDLCNIEGWTAWMRLRALAWQAAKEMSDENELWVSILQNNELNLPA